MPIYEIWTWWPRRQIASNIAGLKVRAQQIAERRSRYGVDNPSNRNGGSSGARATAYDIAEHQVASRQIIGMKEPVGMEIHMSILEKWVNQSSKERAVLSIVGFGGVGKTTVARALYWKVSNKFDCRAFVTVSQNFDEVAVLRNILNQVTQQDANHERHGSIARRLEKNLASQIRSTLKRAGPLIRGCLQQGNDNEMETRSRDELVKQLEKHLTAKSIQEAESCLPNMQNN